ncbi:chemotaxis protein methyltransferase CheR [Gammaproteobacteria bacterium]
MTISVSDQPGVRKISVLGTVESEKDAREIVTACTAAAFRCEVSFFDARTLPAEVIAGLAALIQVGRPLKIYTYEVFLMHALARLGLPVIQVEYREACPRLGEITALVIGGSAESLAPLLHIIEHLPVSPLTIFIVQHIPEDQENILDRLLRVRTGYTVVMPTHLMPVRPGTLYIAPPGHHLKVANGRVYLTRDPKVQFARPSLDVLFETVAAEYGKQALAVLLCGFGQDGVEGSAAIRHHGGWVVVEDNAECHGASLLPDSAKASGACDYVLDLAGLTCFLASLVVGRAVPRRENAGNGFPSNQPTLPLPTEKNLETDGKLIGLFLEAVNSRYGYDFRNYQKGTVERRINKLVSLLGVTDFFALQLEILSDPAAFELFFTEMSVAVTEFFRHPEQFYRLREEIFPYLDSFPLVKIWSAGCATGEEVYSLAILLDELGMLEKSTLFATDMNPYVLRQAEAGFFPRASLETGRANYLRTGGKESFDAYLEDCDDLFLKVSPRLQRRILFHRHSLVHDGVFNEFQLILCRNVLIYFKSELQHEVLERFARSLHRDGFLMLGPSESLTPGAGERFFTNYHREQHIYRYR